MKKIIIAMAALAALFTMGSCSKGLITETQIEEPRKIIISAETDDLATKTALKGNDEVGYGLIWVEGDKIKIGGKDFILCDGAGTSTAKFEGTALPEDGEYTVYYPENYEDGIWKTPQKYSPKNISGLPMKAKVAIKDGVVPALKFAVSEGMLRLVVKSTNGGEAGRIVVDSKDLAAPVVLDCSVGVPLSSEGSVFYIALPEGNYGDVSITVMDTDGFSCKRTLKAGKKLKITRSGILDAALSVTIEHPALLSGLFSVSETKTVCFSSGNLYWDGDSFEIENSQRSFASEWNTSHVSHFYYSASADAACLATGAYSKTGDVLYCAEGAVLFTNRPGFTAAGESDSWRVLSADEWNYLIENNGSAWVKVRGVKGRLIFCNGYNGPKTDINCIPEGCLFLPATGTRCDTSIGPDGSTGGPGTDFSNTGKYGLYWSCEGGAAYANTANYLYFSSSEIRSTSSRSFCGVAIRLVKDAS